MNNNSNNNENTNNVVSNVQEVVNNQSIPVTPVVTPINTQPVVQPQIQQPVSIQEQPTGPQQRVVGNGNNQTIKAVMPQNAGTKSTGTHDTVTPQKPLKEVKIDPNGKKGSNVKYFMVFVLFIALFALVYFLPDISTYINLKKAEREAAKNNVVITTGTLKCTLDKNDSTFDYSYQALFTFTDSKLKKLTYTTSTKGDEKYDADELDKLNTDCTTLDEEVKTLSGISLTCSLSKGTFTKRQVFNYNEIDTTTATSAYSEAGGVYPDYKLDDNIDTIEKEMNNSNYTCTRIK